MISQNNVSLPKQVNNKFKMQRKETEQNINCFKADLSEEEWQNVYIESDVNKAYEHFINKLLYYYNKNIPLNKIKLNKKSNRHPWITRGIMQSIHTRNYLYKLSLRNPSTENHEKYARYRNKLTSIIRLSRKLYYSHQLETNKDNTGSL